LKETRHSSLLARNIQRIARIILRESSCEFARIVAYLARIICKPLGRTTLLGLSINQSKSINRSVYREIGITEFKSKTIKNVKGLFTDWVNPLFVIIKWRLSFVGLMTKTTLTRSGNECCNRQLTPNGRAKY